MINDWVMIGYGNMIDPDPFVINLTQTSVKSGEAIDCGETLRGERGKEAPSGSGAR